MNKIAYYTGYMEKEALPIAGKQDHYAKFKAQSDNPYKALQAQDKNPWALVRSNPNATVAQKGRYNSMMKATQLVRPNPKATPAQIASFNKLKDTFSFGGLKKAANKTAMDKEALLGAAGRRGSPHNAVHQQQQLMGLQGKIAPQRDQKMSRLMELMKKNPEMQRQIQLAMSKHDAAQPSRGPQGGVMGYGRGVGKVFNERVLSDPAMYKQWNEFKGSDPNAGNMGYNQQAAFLKTTPHSAQVDELSQKFFPRQKKVMSAQNKE